MGMRVKEKRDLASAKLRSAAAKLTALKAGRLERGEAECFDEFLGCLLEVDAAADLLEQIKEEVLVALEEVARDFSTQF